MITGAGATAPAVSLAEAAALKEMTEPAGWTRGYQSIHFLLLIQVQAGEQPPPAIPPSIELFPS